MSPLAQKLQALREASPSGAQPGGLIETGVPGVTFFWDESPSPRSPLLYSSGLVIIGQGRKIGYLGGRRFQYDADTCLLLGVPVPFECEVEASPEAPLLGVRLDIDQPQLHALVARYQDQLGFTNARGAAHAGVEPLPLEGPLLGALLRLLDSLRDPIDREVLGAAALDEIVYRVLRSEHGRVLYALTQHQTPYAHVSQALMRIHKDYQQALTVEDLARESAMSVSSFHRAFKQVTGETPLQYLKKLRILKAKALLIFEGLRVEEAAFEVGYGSASQFSREFKRYFKVPPSEAATLPYSDVLQSA